MNDDKLALYESLIRASLLLIFIVSLTVGTFGLIMISRVLMQQAATNTVFPETEAIAAETAR